jgi:hypothetical protein
MSKETDRAFWQAFGETVAAEIGSELFEDDRSLHLGYLVYKGKLAEAVLNGDPPKVAIEAIGALIAILAAGVFRINTAGLDEIAECDDPHFIVPPETPTWTLVTAVDGYTDLKEISMALYHIAKRCDSTLRGCAEVFLKSYRLTLVEQDDTEVSA